jgi:hypothetical protein
MSRILLIIGGVLNLLLAAFHIFLGYKIYQIRDIAAGYRALMIMLNAGGTLFIVLFTVASLAFIQDMLTTRLGKLVTLFVALLYASRAIEEIIVSPKFSAFIFGICVLISAIYLALLLIGEKNHLISNEEQMK